MTSGCKRNIMHTREQQFFRPKEDGPRPALARGVPWRLGSTSAVSHHVFPLVLVGISSSSWTIHKRMRAHTHTHAATQQYYIINLRGPNSLAAVYLLYQLSLIIHLQPRHNFIFSIRSSLTHSSLVFSSLQYYFVITPTVLKLFHALYWTSRSH